ncbi:nicotinamide riboside transporter PnuC [Paenibacillus sp. MBLB4367]|uniref:nicotinamide riboside transporter PnuC n=1 Tax=Paenibacillus sp. MBLB4367 TaxID=3384767 RepID=UPI003907FC57
MNRWYTVAALMAVMFGIAYATSSTPLEIVASATGLLSVWWTARQNIWCWPVGLISVVCFFFMFYEVKLYADMTLQIFFFALSIQGWVVWLTKRGAASVRPTTRITGRLGLWLAVFLIAATGGWGYWLANHTDASIPYMDAFVAILSIAAQFLLSAKKLESWYFWIAVDVLSIGMYAYKELYTFSFLYVIFLGIAIAGLVGWKREFERRGSAGAEAAVSR